MYGTKISQKSEMDRADAACALAMLARELCENPIIYATAGNDSTRIHATALVPARRGFALAQAIHEMCSPLGGGGIFLKQVIDFVKAKERSVDRIIVVTDEQDCDDNKSPDLADAFGTHNYLINVNTYENGIAYGKKWIHINGWSEAVLDYIRVYEEGYNGSKQTPVFTQKSNQDKNRVQPPKPKKINKGGRYAKSRA
jgi:60 kDa SS-A/Ro ribonucleoprotein